MLLIKVKTLKKYEEQWAEIGDSIRSKPDNSDDNDKKYMKIKFNLEGNLLQNKTPELRNRMIVV